MNFVGKDMIIFQNNQKNDTNNKLLVTNETNQKLPVTFKNNRSIFYS